MSNNDKAIINRAKNIMAFITLTCNDDENIDYSALLLVLAQFHFQENDIHGENEQGIMDFVYDLNKFIEQRYREYIIMSN